MMKAAGGNGVKYIRCACTMPKHKWPSHRGESVESTDAAVDASTVVLFRWLPRDTFSRRAVKTTVCLETPVQQNVVCQTSNKDMARS
ncbi:hypothetical protein QWI18_01180 [Pseudomonas sp. W2Oct36]|uniref:hypothetical protein n=1 Tax=unclassified Pseudomonas TaxID=196821 RepID=UPI00177EF596|nr:hypothetical protein [Pseudomonas sp. CFBP 8772]MBD8597625.1 hypothetical protein [Pseudomonas sp. CFBP 8772]